jgi:cytochrome c-type biogenesis protein CcmH/NrfG
MGQMTNPSNRDTTLAEQMMKALDVLSGPLVKEFAVQVALQEVFRRNFETMREEQKEMREKLENMPLIENQIEDFETFIAEYREDQKGRQERWKENRQRWHLAIFLAAMGYVIQLLVWLISRKP